MHYLCFKIKVSNGLRLRHGQDFEDIHHSRSGPLVMSKDQTQTTGPSVQGGQQQGTTADSRPGAPYPLREQDGKIWLTWQGKYF